MSLKIDQSPHYWYPVVFDTVNEDGKKEKIEFDAQFARLTDPEIQELLAPEREAIASRAELKATFAEDLAESLREELKETHGIENETLARSTADFIAGRIADKYEDRILEPAPMVNNDTVLGKVFQGFRKVVDGSNNAVEVTDETKKKVRAIRNCTPAMITAWLKSIGVEGKVKN